MKSKALPSTRIVFLLVFSFLVLMHVTAQSQKGLIEFPRLEPDPQASILRTAYDEADRDSRWLSILEIGLWASSTMPTGALTSLDRAKFVSQIEDSLIKLRLDIQLLEGDRARAEYVLSFMHKHFLRSYIERQTRLDTLLQTGRYNCVSSAVLYSILGTAIGLDVQGEATSDHAFCSVRIGDEYIDVETTSPYGFDPGSRTEFHDEFGKVTGFAYVSPKNYRSRHSLSILELNALIFSNRVSEFEYAGRYIEAVPLSVDRYALLGARGADPELQGRLLNYAVYLAKAGREAESLIWGERAQNIYGTNRGWEDFIFRVQSNIKEKELYLILKEAEKIARELGWLEGLKALDAAEIQFGPETRLSQAKVTFRQNRIAELHNNYARSFNQKRYDEARDLIRSALIEFPEEKRLQEDLERVEKVIAGNKVKS